MRAALLLWLLGLAGCLPGMRDNEPLASAADVKSDAAKTDAAKTDDALDTAADADTTGDSAADVDAAADVSASDVSASDVSADAKPDAAQEVLVGIAGCTSDADCAKLPFGPCQTGACNLATGLCGPQASGDGQPCELSACVTQATCSAGTCSGNEVVCNDGSACTQDACEPGLGCVFAPLTKACDDDKKCTSGDTCQKGNCVGAVKLCEDGNVCTDDLCNEASGECNFKPIASDKTPCSSGNLKGCSGPAVCASGECKAASACDDGNPCTFDLCTDGSTCANLPMAGACVPPGAKADLCNPGICQVKAGESVPLCVTAPLCQDKACSVTNCAAGQCTYDKLDDASSCEDGDACQDQSSCVKGQCKGSKVSCDDGNPCTAELCQPGIGCVASSANDGAPCEDGSGCTTQDACKAGSCTGKPLSCDDKVACTQDACEATGGCVHVQGPDCAP